MAQDKHHHHHVDRSDNDQYHHHYHHQRQSSVTTTATIEGRLLRWMNQQPVLVSLIHTAAAAQRQQHHHQHQQPHPPQYSIRMERFGYGQSNPTFRMTVVLELDSCHDDHHHHHHLYHMNTTAPHVSVPLPNHTSQQRALQQHPNVIELLTLVLRSKPPSVIHTSAHAIHREYAILSAMQQYNQSVVAASGSVSSESEALSSSPLTTSQFILPVPNVYVYCSDTAIMGTSFYIMEYLEGRICTNPIDQFHTQRERQLAYQDVVRLLALLHMIDLSPYIDYQMLLHGGDNDDDDNDRNKSNTPSAASRRPRNGNPATITATTIETKQQEPLNFIERQLLQLSNVSQRQQHALRQLLNDTHQRPQQPSTSSSATDTTTLNNNNNYNNYNNTDKSVSNMMPQLYPIVHGLQYYAPYCPGSTKSTKQQAPPPPTTTTTTTSRNTCCMLIHGDYKMDNFIFHPTLPHVIGIIDWELASLRTIHTGVDPYCDIANLCMMYFIPDTTTKVMTTTNTTTRNDGTTTKQGTTLPLVPSTTATTPSKEIAVTATATTTTVITGIADYTEDQLQSLGIPLRDEAIRQYCLERDQLVSSMHHLRRQCHVFAGGSIPTTIRDNTTMQQLPSWNIDSSHTIHDEFSIIYDWSGYYLTFLFYKNCVILQGVLQRTIQQQQQQQQQQHNENISSSTATATTSSGNDKNKERDEPNNQLLVQQQVLYKKTQLLQRLLPITIHLTIDIWKKYPPPPPSPTSHHRRIVPNNLSHL